MVNKAVSKMAIAEHDNVFIFVPNLIGKFPHSKQMWRTVGPDVNI